MLLLERDPPQPATLHPCSLSTPTRGPRAPPPTHLIPPTPTPYRRTIADGTTTGALEAAGHEVADWLLAEAFEGLLFSFFPCTDVTPALANGGQPEGRAPTAAMLDDPDHSKEVRGWGTVVVGVGWWLGCAVCGWGSRCRGMGLWVCVGVWDGG